MDLSYLQDTDPDEIYKDHDREYPCMTFFYNNNLHIADYPDTHDDLLLEKEVFYDVFPNAKGIITSFQIDDLLNYTKKKSIPFLDAKLKEMGINPQEWKETLGTRGKAIRFGQALLGRIGIKDKELVISFWQHKNHPRFESFLHDPKVTSLVFRRYGRIMGKEWAIVPMDEDPYLFTPKIGEIKSSDAPQKITKMPLKPDYLINGVKVKAEDMVKLRGVIHSSPPEANIHKAALSILCHPDMKKYPELSGFIPNKCLVKSMQKVDPYLAAGRDLYMTAKTPVSTNLLYPAGRATSEGTLGFASWLNSQPS